MRAVVLSSVAALLLSSALVLADDHSVLFDEDVDFSVFKTFAVTDATLKSREPSVNSPVLVKSLAESVRTGLTKKGLTESASTPDLTVECSVTGIDFDMNKWGVIRAMPNDPPSRGRRGAGATPNPNHADFIEATLVLDLKRRDGGALLWRGVFHDSEPDPARLAERLPKDIATLLEKYPVKKK